MEEGKASIAILGCEEIEISEEYGLNDEMGNLFPVGISFQEGRVIQFGLVCSVLNVLSVFRPPLLRA